MEKYLEASDKVANFLASRIGADGRLQEAEIGDDMNPQYKLITLLHISGHGKEAHALLDRFKRDFLQANGDLLSYPSKSGKAGKSIVGAMQHHWIYINLWVAMGAHRAGRFDISLPVFNYCKTFYSPAVKGCCVTDAYDADDKSLTVDTMSSAHFGLCNLYFGDLEMAKNCGENLLMFMDKQPDMNKEWQLRMSAQRVELITDIPADMESFYVVKKSAQYQRFFFLGYHAILLAKLYTATNDERFLHHAKRILDFALECDQTLYKFHLSHKVAYGAALVAAITGDKKYKELSQKIADFLVSVQTEEGLFCKELRLTDKYNQSAEIGIWLREIYAELSKCS